MTDNLSRAHQLLASGQLDKGRELLHRCLQFPPGHSHSCVALALGYQRAGDLLRAREYTMQALAADPRDPVAQNDEYIIATELNKA